MRVLIALLLLTSLTAGRLPSDWPPTLPTGASDRLEAWFLGNTTLLFRSGDQAIMIDGFLSRPTSLFATVRSDAGLLRSCLDQIGIRVKGGSGGAQLKAVLVAHGHYDHALDAANVARLTGATVAAAPATLRTLKLDRYTWTRPFERNGQADDDERAEEFGRFRVREFRFAHSRPNLFRGVVGNPIKLPASAFDFRDNASSAFLIDVDGARILVHPSAGFEPVGPGSRGYDDVTADVIFLSFGGLGVQPADRVRDYWNAVVAGRKARLVVPIHWDSINRPLSTGFRRSYFSYGPQPAMRQIAMLARNGPVLRLMPFFQPVPLDEAIQGAVPEGPSLSMAAPECARRAPSAQSG